MNNIRAIFYILVVFMWGSILNMNLTILLDVGQHYEASWVKVVISICFAVMFGYLAVTAREQP